MIFFNICNRHIHPGTIEKQIHEDIPYDDIYQSKDNLWNFLFFTGYMKKVSERQDPDTPEKLSMTMKIPNIEIRSIYNNQIRMWFEKQIQREDRSLFYQAVLNGDTAGIEKTVSHLLEKSISVFDSSEAFYHGFFISLLSNLPNYALRSNREEGSGRPDIVLYPVRYRDPAIIFAIKRRKKYKDMESGLEEAFAQIKNEQYEEDILNDGCLSVKSYAICFCKKSCIVGAMNKTHST